MAPLSLLPCLAVAGLLARSSYALLFHEAGQDPSVYSQEHSQEEDPVGQDRGVDLYEVDDEGKPKTSEKTSVTPRPKLQFDDVEAFTATFRQNYALDHRTRESMPKEVQLAVGVFTIAAEQPHRQVVRETWMKQNGVCDLTKGKKDGCTVYAAFVIGNSGKGKLRGAQRELASEFTSQTAIQEPGMVVLNMTENINGGKTYEFFKLVATQAPWITHVAKCDMDTYPALHKLVWKIREQSKCIGTPFMYAGKPASCAPKGCAGFLQDSQNAQICSSDRGCGIPSRNFTHAQGQFYLLSMPLVKKIAVQGTFWERHKNATHEDIVTGAAVADFASGTGAPRAETECVHVWDPDAWCHRDACTKNKLFDIPERGAVRLSAPEAAAEA